MILFDFDGVFVNTFELLRVMALDIDGVHFSPEEYRDFFNGHIFDSHLRAKLKSFDDPALRRRFLEVYRAALPTHALISGIDVVVAEVARQYPVHLVTSGDEISIHDYLENKALRHHFRSLLGWQTHESKVEKFKMLGIGQGSAQPALFVTDTLGDIAQAHALGIPTIAVTWGFHEEERLRRGNPYAIVNTPVELERCIKHWGTLNL